MTREDVALGREMAAAAKAATEASIAAGFSRSDKVTKDSAKRAADEVYLRSRGHHEVAEPRVIDQPRRGEAQEAGRIISEADAEQEARDHVFDVQDDAWQDRRDLD